MNHPAAVLASVVLLAVSLVLLLYGLLALAQWRQDRRIATEGDWLQGGSR